METKIETKDSIKQFIHDNRNVLIASGVSLVGGFLLGYTFGHTDGIKQGRNKILDEIVSISCNGGGLIMNNPDLGRYIFIAKKLDK
jgi:hypothetical protein